MNAPADRSTVCSERATRGNRDPNEGHPAASSAGRLRREPFHRTPVGRQLPRTSDESSSPDLLTLQRFARHAESGGNTPQLFDLFTAS
jgi:hypothetical protein